MWNPYLVKDIKLIGVQRRATKMVRGIEHLTYYERMKSLELSRLDQEGIVVT